MWAQENIVSIPDIQVGSGKTVSMPVVVTNSTDIVAVQFTLTVPKGFSIDTSSAVLTDRCPAHSIMMTQIDTYSGSRKYMAMIFSSDNTAISGSDGAIMNVDLSASSDVNVELEYPMTLSDVVLAQKNGDNMVTQISAGSISLDASPDLAVSDISATDTSIMPGSQLTVNWKVSNVGHKKSTEGWETEIFLANDKTSRLVYSDWKTETLAENASVECNASFTLPDILGLDGDTKILVKISSSDEARGLQENNSAYSGSNVNIGKQLYINYPTLLVVEEEGKTYLYKLSRSGNTSLSETFAIALSPEDTRFAFDSEVTIPVGQSEVYFYVKVNPNNVVDDINATTLTVSGNDYPSVASAMSIEDDVFPDVVVGFDRDKVVEGEDFTLTVTAYRPVDADTPVTISCENPLKFTIPVGVVIPAGQQSVDIKISSNDDTQPDLDHDYGFSASIDKHNPVTDYITLGDNDMPTMTMKLTPDAVSEDAGPLSVTAVIKRTDNIDKKITIQLRDNSDGQIYYGLNSFDMAAGTEETVINLGPIDNSLVDGERTFDITAAVYIASCSCAASDMTSGGIVKVPLTIFDNDGPALSLTTNSTVLKEGSELSIEVSRNTSVDSDLTVNIGSDYAGRLEYPASVVIPAGESKASFIVKSLANDTSNDGFNVVFTASADGFAKSTTWLTVTDQTLPDARIVSISAPAAEVIAGEELMLEIVVANDGTYELGAGVPVSVYSDSSHGISNEIATVYTAQSVAPGESITINCRPVMNVAVGECSIHAVVNNNKSVKELVYTNNSSNIINVSTISPFTVSVSTDKAIYQPEEKVVISGKLSGTRIAGEDVEVYVINNSYRKTISAKSDDNGDFSCEYTPYSGQTGHFVIGACYPGENLLTEMTAVDIYGFKRAQVDAISFDIIKDQPYAGSFNVINTGTRAQTNVTASVVSIPDGCVAKITGVETLDEGKTYKVNYEITGSRVSVGREYEKCRINVASEEGGNLNTDIYFYCIAEESVLTANIDRINTTVTKGTPREFPFEINNIGKGETGKITFKLPDWITPVTAKEMNSLKQNESADVVLRISAEDNFPLNEPITGSISLLCETGKSLVLPINITPVSDLTGKISIDVCDENSYYSATAPHVSGASVKVFNRYTGKVVAEGVTGDNGIFSAEDIPEGYYSLEVSEPEGHSDSYSGMILIDPGVVTSRVINLSLKGIDMDWSVERTEIEDEYEITTTVKFEVNVPVPVVELIVPKEIDIDVLGEDESVVFNAVLVNHGLVTAEDVDLLLPTGFGDFTFEKLSYQQPFDLGAKQSVQIPVKITRRAGSGTSTQHPCLAQIGALYFWDCGLDRKWHQYYVSIQVGPCRTPDVVYGGGGGFVGGGGGGGSWPGYHSGPGSSSNYVVNVPSIVIDTDKGCEPCQNSFLFKMTSCFVKRIPLISQILDFVDQVNCATGNAGVKEEIKCVLKQIPVMKDIVEWVDFYTDCLVPLFEDCVPGDIGSDVPVISDSDLGEFLAKRLPYGDDVSGYPSYVMAYLNKLSPLMNSINAIYGLTTEICGDPCWNYVAEEELSVLSAQLVAWDGTYESIAKYKPTNVTDEQFRKFTTRLTNTYEEVESDNIINVKKFSELYHEVSQVIDFSVKNGYASLPEMLEKETNSVMSSLNESRNSVCSTITLEFKQKMVMTREAFRGTLIVKNNHESLPIEDFKLYLTVADKNGKIATAHEFQTSPESLAGFEGALDFEAGWKLDSKSEGKATVLFIPTKYAAPTEPQDYSFGGFVSFINPFTGTETVRSLTPVTLTVSPSPNLDLTYFMQRDVIGDDPLTEAVEASQEAEFSLLINNTGYGDASNVKMFTYQPEIIDNRKGVPLQLSLLSGQLNGGDKSPSVGGTVATDFGTIPAHSTSYAQWWFTSSLLGHFVEYNVKANHVTGNDNPDLSLLGDVTIHELIRSIKVGLNDDNVIGFLTNDLTDENDTPDMLYVSDGDVLPVATAASCSIEKISDTQCRLTVQSNSSGWVYGNDLVPTYGSAELQSVVRESDDASMPLRNFWLTDRTLRDGRDPLYENRLHFADDISNGSETYILNFEPMPVLRLAIVSIDGVPAEGTVLSKPLESVNVVFNKHIDPSTFTTDDISLSTQGEPRDVSLIDITTEDNKTFRLDFSKLNDNIINGYNVLSVQAADITDTDGFNGKDGKQAGWVMYFNNLARLRVEVQPENAGVVSVPEYTADQADSSIRYVTYGSTIDIEATSNPGFDFVGWYIGDECLSTDLILSRTMDSDVSMIAKFAKRKVNLTIIDNIDGGQVAGANTGVYLYGDKVNLEALADEDFLFESWIFDGESKDGESKMELELTDNIEVSAEFIRDIYSQTFTLYEGWNWISSYLKEPIEVVDFNSRANRILGQFSESIQDPLFGMTGDVENFNPGQSYKVNSNVAFLKTIKGHLYNLTEMPIELHAGWNWISYPYFETMTIDSAIMNASEGDFLVSQLGFAEYSEGQWAGSVQALVPGSGYLYKSVADKSLGLDLRAQTQSNQASPMRKIAPAYGSDELDIHKYPNTMNMTIALMADGEQLFASDYVIYAMAGNECRGISVNAGDLYYLTVYGDEPVSVAFVVENTLTGETFLGSDNVQFQNDIVGSRKNPYVVSLTDCSGVNVVSGELHKMRIYTPSGILINEDADFETIKSLTPGIYIIDGRKVLVK